MTPSIAVLGAGFGGLAAACQLRALLPNARITVIDRADAFYMGFAKLWDLAGTRPLAGGTRPLSNLTNLDIDFVQADITAFDAQTRTITTSVGSQTADIVIVALGAATAPAHGQMLAHDHAHNLYDGAALPAIREQVAQITSGTIGVCILGGPHKCPPAPYEAALIIKQLLAAQGVADRVDVVLTTPAPMTLPVAGPDASSYIATHLSTHNIELRAGHRATSIDGLQVTFDGHPSLDVDILLGVPAGAAPALLQSHELTGPSGWVEPDRDHFTTGFDGVYAIGDCTMIPTANGQLPMAGVFAAGAGRAVADHIAARFGGAPSTPFDGHGFCFLELPNEHVAFVEGDFYATPPDVILTEASHELFLRKQAYEREHLELWLPS